MREILGILRGKLYRIVMRVSHQFNWHYAPPIYPDGNTQLWCKWCGFRETVKRRGDYAALGSMQHILDPHVDSAKANDMCRLGVVDTRNPA